MTIYNGLSPSAAKVFSAAAYPKAILHRQFPFVFGAQQAVEGFRERFLLPETAPPFTEVYGIQHERVFIAKEQGLSKSAISQQMKTAYKHLRKHLGA